MISGGTVFGGLVVAAITGGKCFAAICNFPMYRVPEFCGRVAGHFRLGKSSTNPGLPKRLRAGPFLTDAPTAYILGIPLDLPP